MLEILNRYYFDIIELKLEPEEIVLAGKGLESLARRLSQSKYIVFQIEEPLEQIWTNLYSAAPGAEGFTEFLENIGKYQSNIEHDNDLKGPLAPEADSIIEDLIKQGVVVEVVYDEVKEREKASFILDKTVLKIVCESGTICLSEVRQKVAFLEKALGEKIGLAKVQAVCDRYVQEGLIRSI